MQTTDKRGDYNRMLGELKQIRVTWEPPLRDIGDYILPYAHEWEQMDANNGRRRDSLLINNTPTRACDVGVSGLFNGLCDPTEQWAGIEAVDRELNKVHSVREYCEEVIEILLGELTRSNFYNVVPEDFEAILGFGTCASLCLESFDHSALWFGSLPMGSYYISNNARRKVDTVAREIQMTARQMAAEFPAENLSDAVKQALAAPGKAETLFSVVHLVHPNPAYVPGRMLSKDKRFRSCYYEPSAQGEDPNKMLLEEGFDTFPIQVARWKTRGANPWGFGAGHYALGDSKALQTLEYDIAMAVELQLKPPTISGPGTNFSALSVLPGANTQAVDAASAAGLRPLYEVSFDIQKARVAVAEHEERIREAFFNNIFLMLANDDGGKMTAREVAERAREKRLALTPILRLTNEYLTPRLARCIDILGKRGMLPPLPQELQGQPLKLTYKSVLAQAAMLERAAAVAGNMLNVILPLAEADPTILDNYDMDELSRGQSMESGTPARYLRDPKKVEEIRRNRAAEQAKDAQAERANLAAQTAKTLADTDTTGKNALTDIAETVEQ